MASDTISALRWLLLCGMRLALSTVHVEDGGDATVLVGSLLSITKWVGYEVATSKEKFVKFTGLGVSK